MNKKSLKIVKAETEAIETALDTVMPQLARNEKAVLTPINNELVAEAYRLTGRVEAFDCMSKFATVSNLLTLKSIKESKIYKEMKDVGTWSNYCQLIGFSARKIDEDLDNLEILGGEFLETVSNFRLSYRDLRKLKSSTKSGTFEILEDAISIDGEIVALSDTERLKEVLETVIELKDDQIQEKERIIKAKEELNNELSNQREVARREAKEYKHKINNYVTGKEFLVDVDELPDFRELKVIEDRLTSIYIDMNRLSNNNLSERNQHIFGGCVVLGFKLLEDIRLKLNNSTGSYFDRLYMDDNELAKSDSMFLPSSFKKSKEKDQ